MITYLSSMLLGLSAAANIGNISAAREIAERELSKYASVTQKGGNTIGVMGEGEYTLMLAAHIDEVGFIVTDVSKEGFLSVAACGGIDTRFLPSRRVTVHGRRDITGTFCSTPPHLKGGKEQEAGTISDYKIDTLLGEKAKDVISIGDYVTFCEEATNFGENRITGKAIDDRAGVACLLEVAKRLHGKSLPIKVAFTLTGEEELGCRGAKTAAFSLSPDEAIAIDVTFGDAPDVGSTEGKKLGGGAMIGVSPILCRTITEKLTKTAKENSIPFDMEIMAAKTGTDGDVIAVTGSGVKTGLLSIPIRNMHSPAEVVDTGDIKAVCDILEKYILSGGIKNV